MMGVDGVRVLETFQRADMRGALLWHVSDGEVNWYAQCSDTFSWATADAEPINTPEDVDLLIATLEDLLNLEWNGPEGSDATEWLGELYAARRRGRRPMSAFFAWHSLGPVRDLFMACEPPRDPAPEG